MDRKDDVDIRQRFVEGWNNTMIDIWTERIRLLDVVDTGALLRSPVKLPVQHDGRFLDLTLSQTFLEYGLWQDLGVGRELHHGEHERNKEYIENHVLTRDRRRWFSVKYYSSVMKLRDFMAYSIGAEFKSMFCAALDADEARYSSAFYRRKGYTR